MRKTVTAVLLVGYLLLLFYLTLYWRATTAIPREGRLNLALLKTISWYLHVGGRELVVNILGNLAAFVPVGVLWPLLRGERARAWGVGLAAAGLSLLVETLQFASGYRIADIDDVVLNTLGGLLGFAFFVVVRHLVRQIVIAEESAPGQPAG